MAGHTDILCEESDMNLPKDDPVANKSPIAQKEAPLLLGDKYPKGLNHSKIEVWMYVYVCVYIYICISSLAWGCLWLWASCVIGL